MKFEDMSNISKIFSSLQVKNLSGARYDIAMGELNKFSNAVANINQQIIKAVTPYYNKFINIVPPVISAFDHLMRDEYAYKQAVLDMWEDFVLEIRRKRRYFPKSEFISIFDKCASEARCILKKDSTFFRARIIGHDEFPDGIRSALNTAFENIKDYENKEISEKSNDIWDFIFKLPYSVWEFKYLNPYQLENVIFWGFDEDGSDAPRENVLQGRVNPPGISCLYAANSIITAISEVQPSIGQTVSVGKIKTRKDMNIFDFSFSKTYKDSDFLDQSVVEIKKKYGISIGKIAIFLNTLSELFSRPAMGNVDNYYATQYLGEYIKNLGFDGIRYKSSLKKGGTNIVLFDTSKGEDNNPINYKILCSSVHKIESVKISSIQVFPKDDPENTKNSGKFYPL
jgi:copper chaperone CopZ